MEHLQVLVVVVPLLAAPLCAMLPDRRLSWGLATLATAASLVMAGLLLEQVQALGPRHYALGGWPPPWGIEYRLDAASAMVQLVVAALATVVMAYAGTSAAREIHAEHQGGFYAAMLLLVAGLLGITATGDAFNAFVFLEISSLSSYALIALGRDRRALTASFRYLIMGTVGATFYLIGVGLLYAMTGTLNMADLAERLPAVAGTRTVQTAAAFLVTGICLKLALFPLHLWLPNAYTFAPSAVGALLAATSTKVAVYLLVRILYTVLGPGLAFGQLPIAPVLMVLAVTGMLTASAVAVAQPDARRLLAYSSVAQVGYMVLGIALGSLLGLTAALLHLLNHALMKGALFLALGCISYRVGGTAVASLAGLGRQMPWTMAAVVAGGLSLVGVPLTVGFVSKWYLVLAALEAGAWWLVAAILLSSLLALAYVWRLVEVAYFRSPAGTAPVAEAPWSLLLPTWLLVLANVWFGVDAGATVALAEQAARALQGPGP